MSTLEQLEAEAAELYPNGPGRMFNGEPFPRFEQQAHIQAKTITAEQVEDAAKALARWDGATGWGTPLWDGEIDESAYKFGAIAAFRAAGFYVEEAS